MGCSNFLSSKSVPSSSKSSQNFLLRSSMFIIKILKINLMFEFLTHHAGPLAFSVKATIPVRYWFPKIYGRWQVGVKCLIECGGGVTAEIPHNLRIIEYNKKIRNVKLKTTHLFPFIFIPMWERNRKWEKQWVVLAFSSYKSNFILSRCTK